MGAGSAGNSACKFSKVGLWLSRLPSTQKKGGLRGSAQQDIRFSSSKKEFHRHSDHYLVLISMILYDAWKKFKKNIQRWSIILCVTCDLLWSSKMGLYCQNISTLGLVCGAKRKKNLTALDDVWPVTGELRFSQQSLFITDNLLFCTFKVFSE